MKITGQLMNVAMTADNTNPKVVVYTYTNVSLQQTIPNSEGEIQQVATFTLVSIGEPYPWDFTKTYEFTIEPLVGDVGKGSVTTFTCNGATAYGGARVWTDDDGEQPPVIEPAQPTAWTYGLSLIDISNDSPKVVIQTISFAPVTGTLDIVPGPQFYIVTFGPQP